MNEISVRTRKGQRASWLVLLSTREWDLTRHQTYWVLGVLAPEPSEIIFVIANLW